MRKMIEIVLKVNNEAFENKPLGELFIRLKKYYTARNVYLNKSYGLVSS